MSAVCDAPIDAARAARVRDLCNEPVLQPWLRCRLARWLLLATPDQPDLVALAHEQALLALAHRPARQLAAYAYDRLRVLRGELQKFGTQRGEDGAPWPTDPATTDSERAKWDVPSRAELERAPFALTPDAGAGELPCR